MLYLITAPVDVNGKHWELDFTRGRATTEDNRVADRYRRRGYAVDELEEVFSSGGTESAADEPVQLSDEPASQGDNAIDIAEEAVPDNSDEETRDEPCRTSRKRTTKP